jgi:hypothetical protein
MQRQTLEARGHCGRIARVCLAAAPAFTLDPPKRARASFIATLLHTSRGPE